MTKTENQENTNTEVKLKNWNDWFDLVINQIKDVLFSYEIAMSKYYNEFYADSSKDSLIKSLATYSEHPVGFYKDKISTSLAKKVSFLKYPSIVMGIVFILLFIINIGQINAICIF